MYIYPNTLQLTTSKCNLWRMQVNHATAIARYMGDSFSKYPRCESRSSPHMIYNQQGNIQSLLTQREMQ